MTRGATRSIQSSSRIDRGIKLHRTDVICRDGRYVVDGHDLSRSEALRGRSWFFAIEGVVWMLSDWTILIGWLSITPTSFHCGDAWNSPDRWISIRRQRIVVEEPHDRDPIEPQSSRDRGAIEPRSHSFRRGIVPQDQTGADRAPGSRSTHDRGPIAARSWCDRGQIWSRFEADGPLNPVKNHRGIEAMSSPSGTAPTTLANRLHDRSNDPRIRANFFFKTGVFSLLCSQLLIDSEGIKRISRKISSSSWSPHV